ncbi:MAG: GTPase Era [Ignavibacteriaceae bacterium]|nr:GTPase Era [Ignavibacteriaceae bacterium]
MKFKSGYVAILGLPNVGKSTLLNSLLKQKLSIISPKPQTTRKKILGILSEENFQIIFLDTPGILKPRYLLQEKMAGFISDAVKDADIFVLMIDISSEKGKETLNDEFVKLLLSKTKKPVILLLNKVDLSKTEIVKKLINEFESMKKFRSVIPVSAIMNFNVDRVLSEILDLLPEGPRYYPEDQLTDENERFFVSEIIREKILELYFEELPYSCEVVIIEFKERDEAKDFISAEIIVEKESQRAIIIGKGGSMIKKLGLASRKSIEDFLQREVYLELNVKVRKNWRKDEKMLKAFGYGDEE